jgi:YD repeat-containing protein
MTLKMKPLFLILLSFLFFSFGGNKHKNGLALQNLKGKVKCVVEKDYLFVDSLGNNKRDSLLHTYTYFYNESGNEVKIFEKRVDRYDGDTTWSTYDSSGRLSCKTMYNGFSHITSKRYFRRDVSQNKIVIDEPPHREGVTMRMEILCDQRGNEIENNLYENDTLVTKNVFRYDENDNQIEMDCYGEYKKLWFKGVYTYNSDGNMATVKSANVDNKGADSATFRYEDTDKNGNWLRQIEESDGKPYKYIKREIQYY